MCFGLRNSRLAVHHYRSPLKTHVDLLPPGLNYGLDSGFLGRKGVGQIELSFGYSGRIMLLDGQDDDWFYCWDNARHMTARFPKQSGQVNWLPEKVFPSEAASKQWNVSQTVTRVN
jgi:hypothetical protein